MERRRPARPSASAWTVTPAWRGAWPLWTHSLVSGSLSLCLSFSLSLSYPRVYERLLACDTLEQHPILLSALAPMSPCKLGTAEASPAWVTSAPSVYSEHSGCQGVGFLTHFMKKWPFSRFSFSLCLFRILVSKPFQPGFSGLRSASISHDSFEMIRGGTQGSWWGVCVK